MLDVNKLCNIEQDPNKKYVVSFSGGKDSTALLLLLFKKNFRIDQILCCDTGVEHPEMYEHIEKIKKMIAPLEITILKSDKSFEYWMFDHVKTKGKNMGQKGYSWPDFRNRWCTAALKRDMMLKYMNNTFKGEDIVEVHGISFDESERTENNSKREIIYPLVQWKLTGKDCLEYCYSLGLNWGGVYEKVGRMSCWCCPLQAVGGLRYLYHEKPELWEKLKEWEANTYRTFKPKGKDIFYYDEKFKKEDEKKHKKENN